MSKKEPYGINAVINKIQRETTQPFSAQDDSRRRTTSFNEKLLNGVVERAEREGITLDLKEEPVVPPPPKPTSRTVLPSIGTKRVKGGLKIATGVFSLVHEMQQLDDSALLLFYLEVSREYEERTSDPGWTSMVMEHVMSHCQGSPETASAISEEPEEAACSV